MSWYNECCDALRWSKGLCADIIKSRVMRHLCLIASFFTVFIGVILFVVDPNIKSPIDGIWSALSTITHVGFGDVTPVSVLGRLLSSVLILLGLVMFPLFTALISVILINQSSQSTGSSVGEMESLSHHQVLTELAILQKRMMQLEQSIAMKHEAKKQ